MDRMQVQSCVRSKRSMKLYSFRWLAVLSSVGEQVLESGKPRFPEYKPLRVKASFARSFISSPERVSAVANASV